MRGAVDVYFCLAIMPVKWFKWGNCHCPSCLNDKSSLDHIDCYGGKKKENPISDVSGSCISKTRGCPSVLRSLSIQSVTISVPFLYSVLFVAFDE